MRKYKVIVGGRGAECYIHQVEGENKKLLFEGGVEEDKMDPEQIAELLDCDFVTDTDDSVLGAYNNPELYYITVYDENENIVWQSDVNHEFVNEQNEYRYENDSVLVVEDYIKGQFFMYDLEIEHDFDHKLLTPIVTDVAESVEIITDLLYNDVELNPFKDYGDYWSKGLTYYLN
jgi:hypothetical protein